MPISFRHDIIYDDLLVGIVSTNQNLNSFQTAFKIEYKIIVEAGNESTKSMKQWN